MSDCPFPKRGEIPAFIRALKIGEHVHFSVGTKEVNIRSSASQIGLRLKRKFIVHRYPDATVAVWRKE